MSYTFTADPYNLVSWTSLSSFTERGTQIVTCLFKFICYFLFVFIYFLKKIVNVYFWERERERERAWHGERQRKKETQNLKQAPGSELSAQSPLWGWNSWVMGSWPIYLFTYFIREREREKERESTRREGRGAEGGRETVKLSTEPDTGPDPTTLGSWPEQKSRAQCSTNRATQAPSLGVLLKKT